MTDATALAVSWTSWALAAVLIALIVTRRPR